MLAGLAVLFMAKFYAHELTLGQTNIMLGCLLAAALLAVQIDQPVVAGRAHWRSRRSSSRTR